jgi:hypothetical protein
LLLGKGVAFLAVTYHRQRITEGASELGGAGAITLEYVERHALGRFGPDAGQAAQRVDQLL